MLQSRCNSCIAGLNPTWILIVCYCPIGADQCVWLESSGGGVFACDSRNAATESLRNVQRGVCSAIIQPVGEL